MSNRSDIALENHKKKYNCCQAVACAFADKVGIDEPTLFKMTEGFGLGMGCTEGTCGAVSGAILLAGLKNSNGAIDNPTTKAGTYKLSSEIIQKFKDKNGSVVCREIKGLDNGTVLRSCDGCIEDAAKIVEEILDL